jgi:hypothetical protein
MSLDLPLVSLAMYLQEGEVNPGDEGKVIRFEKKMSDWRRDVVGGLKNFRREDMSSGMCKVEKGFTSMRRWQRWNMRRARGRRKRRKQ